mgnify:CR=1 FL=1
MTIRSTAVKIIRKLLGLDSRAEIRAAVERRDRAEAKLRNARRPGAGAAVLSTK